MGSTIDVDNRLSNTSNAGPGGRTEGGWRGRTGGRGVLNDSTTIFIAFLWRKKRQYNDFIDFERQYNDVHRFLQKKKHSNIDTVFFAFQITQERKYQLLLSKTQFLGTAPDPADPGNPLEMEHELRLATYSHHAGGQDDVSLNKLPQMNWRKLSNF